ncbi:hypothetical protein CROQUDRAFT_88083 [Cronartium quercuum f. sp. fusiforme G11]|uniref:Uncharacterized protein n=1 Tax=Cronartium quercuum f. sp. fusiforme G11 TaxID=708437 RepID=A0A9P6NU75_9BASI|nr:hypothetical protein CROQUDRAFT_88083 [Cronartium quercuum f. sp. fusiforme G11]
MDGIPPENSPGNVREEDVLMDNPDAPKQDPQPRRTSSQASSKTPAPPVSTPQVIPPRPQTPALNSPNPFNPLSDLNRVVVTGLAKFEEKRMSKKRARLGVSCLSEDDTSGISRSKRFLNLFPDCASNPTMSDAIMKLHHLIEVALPLPKEGGDIVKVRSDTVTNIRTIMARVVEMDQHRATVRSRENKAETEEERAMRPTASSNSFASKVPDALETRLVGLQCQLDMVIHTLGTTPKAKAGSNQTQARPNGQNPHTTPPTLATTPTPSYALTASKHAPARPPQQTPTPTRHPSKKQNCTAMIFQRDILSLVNKMLKAKNIKSKTIGFQAIKIKAVHRHPSNDLNFLHQHT